MSRDELIDLIILNIDNNNAGEIDYARMREVLNEMLDTLLSEITSATDGAIPYVKSGKYQNSSAFVFADATGELQLSKIRLANGQTLVERIHNSGTLTAAQKKVAVPTVWSLSAIRPSVIGTISTPIDLDNNLRVGDTVTLDGDIEHVIVEGDTFQLLGQSDLSENKPYTATGSATVPTVADWYVADKNQEILIEKGPAVRMAMPAVEEGQDPVTDPDFGRMAYDIFFSCNY